MDPSYPYVLVMPRAAQSLHGLLMSQRVAGYDADRAMGLFRQAAERVAELHAAAGLLHFDIKPRNVLVLEDGSVKLCDLDASMQLGATRGPDEKPGSSGYYAPEVARWAEDPTAAPPLVASAALDVWSLGALLFELCIGRTLFRQDIGNDDLVDTEDLARLFTWRTVSDQELADVFHGAEEGGESDDALAISQRSAPAKHLLRWCLKGRPEERPTMAQLLAHPFLLPQPDLPAHPVQLPMRYSFFISHAQADAASTAKSFFSVCKRLGVHCWYDMEQAQLTLEGMREGVRASDRLLLVLTENVLTRWFCQQEISTAVEEGTSIQLLVEEDERFAPFDAATWRSFSADTPEDHAKICGAVETAPPSAVAPPARLRGRRHDEGAAASQRAAFASSDGEKCWRGAVSAPAWPGTSEGRGLVPPRRHRRRHVRCAAR